MPERKIYLENTPVDEAVEKFIREVRNHISIVYEKTDVTESLGRITSEAVIAKYSSPLFNASAMDGIAVISERTFGARETEPVILKEGEDYITVDTGDPVEAPYDAVIMIEDITDAGPGKASIMASVSPWTNIRPVGEDIVAGEMILPGNHTIRAIDIGVLLSGGITEINVIRRPTVAIFPTGSELIEPWEEPVKGSIIESNSRMFENMVTEEGGIGVRYPVIKDDYEKIRSMVSEAVKKHDIVIINAGSSAGREDYTVHVLEELGNVIIHGVAMKPGKPVILSLVEGKPVIGLPGYPVSAYIAFRNFVSPVISMFLGKETKKAEKVEAVISRRLISSLKHKEYVRVKAGKVDGKLVASPLQRGAGAAMSLVRADGFCIIDQNCEGVEAGETVNLELYRSREEIENTVMVTGSHDLILDIIADEMSGKRKGAYISSTHTGSMAGLMALKRGESQIAPIHLLDENTGEYNISYIKQLFDEPMILIRGVTRIQGIMVKKGNPLGINSLGDLRRARYINRQRGAGTRVLFDYLLKKEGVEKSRINGYDIEASTHMAVAALVRSPNADAGMGIYSAANSMGLDFIPVGKEEYDFAVPERFMNHSGIRAFIEILKSDDFRTRVNNLGGYGTENSGETVKITWENQNL